MTFAALLAELYEDLGFQSSPASAVVTRIKRAVNTAHESIHAEPGLASLRYGTLTVASVASQARYGLSNVAQVRAFTEATNDRRLQARSLSWYRSRNPDPASNEGVPEVYIPLGQVAVAQVPVSTGTGLWIVSSSASDTVPTVTVDAIRVGGYPHSPSAATVNGLTRVQIGGGSGLTDYIDVTQFQLSAACVGDISLYDASSSGNLLAVIPRGQTSSRYWGFILSPTPSSAVTYTVDVEHEILPLVNDTDEPLLPQLFHRLPGIKARMKEYEGKDDTRYTVAEKEYARELQKLKYSLVGDVTVPGGASTEEGSNLGAWFPAGRWS
jgi:hypothetical protein